MLAGLELGLFEIILSLIQMVLLAIIVLLLMVHVLRTLNLLCLGKLHVVLTSSPSAILIVRREVTVVVG